MRKWIDILRDKGIQPTAQRLAVANSVLDTDTHPSADQVWARVQEEFPTISRATVYNTLNLFAEQGLVRKQVLREGTVVFDPIITAHHHFVDVETGEIHDIPWDAIEVKHVKELDNMDVLDFQVIVRGKWKGGV